MRADGSDRRPQAKRRRRAVEGGVSDGGQNRVYQQSSLNANDCGPTRIHRSPRITHWISRRPSQSRGRMA